MKHHITSRRIYTSDWEFVRSYTPKRTAFGCVLSIVAILVAIAVVAMVTWLIAHDPDTLRLALIVTGLTALWIMAKGARR